MGLLGCLSISVFACKTFAQSSPSNIVPDNTLDAESSQVLSNYQGQPIEAITGGATRGINLFHSFREFNVNNGRGTYFFSPNAEIQNIFSRVTGRNRSEILGTLGTFGKSPANLFLINPSGIVFGENASLDVDGSFVGTTASAIEFGEQGIFSATNPKPPSQLLTINPSAFLFNQINKSAGIESKARMSVTEGENLLLLGGNISMDNAGLSAPDGRIELGGLAAPGTVGLNVNQNILSFNFPENVQIAEVLITNSSLDVVSQGTGEIIINAGKLDVSNSTIYAGNNDFRDISLSLFDNLLKEDFDLFSDGFTIEKEEKPFLWNEKEKLISSKSNLNLNPIIPGNIELNATGVIAISNTKVIYTESPENTEKLGEINIKANSLTLEDSLIRTNDVLYDYSGDININTADSVNVVNSTILAKTRFGHAGNLRINTKKLYVRDGGQLATLSLTEGKGGELNVNASEQIVLSGSVTANIFDNTDILESPSGLYTVTLGDPGGDLHISTPKLVVEDGAVILTRTAGEGNSGNISINAFNSIELNGTSSIDLPSGIFNLTESSGASGNTTINTQKLKVQNGAQIANSINVSPNTYILSFAEPSIYFRSVEAGLLTDTVSYDFAANTINYSEQTLGNAGNITINADSVDLRNTSSNNRFASGIFSQAPISSSSGDIEINAVKMNIEKGAQISTSTSGEGQGGNLTVNTLDSTEIKGTSDNSLPGGLFTQASGRGSAGNINIDSGNLTVTDGSVVSAGTTTDSEGNGGNINIRTSEFVFVSGTSKDGLSSGFSASTRGSGASGNVNITTNNLRVQDGAVVSVTTDGSGAGGKLDVNAADTVEVSGMSADKAVPSGLFARTFSNGSAGNLGITTKKLTVRDGAQVTVSSLGSSEAGNLEVTVSDILLDNQAKLIADTLSGNGGNINLEVADLILMRRNSQISTNAGTAQQGGDGGNIDINSKFIIAIPEENSDITANAFTGTGGKVQIFSQGVFGIEPREQPNNITSDITASSEQGVQGVTTVDAPDNSSLQNSLNQLSENPIDANALIANSCIARRNTPSSGTFFITGKGGLPERPGEAGISRFSTGGMQDVSTANVSASRREWKIGDSIIEPTGVYKLADGRLILSRECD
jgi:filamentous hemagglutinin family protein